MGNFEEAWMWKRVEIQKRRRKQWKVIKQTKAKAGSPRGWDVWAERPGAESEGLRRDRQKEQKKEGGSNQGESRRFLCNTHRPRLSPSSTILADWREGFVWRGGQDHQYLVKGKSCPEERRGSTPSWGIHRGIDGVYMCEYVLCARESTEDFFKCVRERAGEREREGVWLACAPPIIKKKRQTGGGIRQRFFWRTHRPPPHILSKARIAALAFAAIMHDRCTSTMLLLYLLVCVSPSLSFVFSPVSSGPNVLFYLFCFFLFFLWWASMNQQIFFLNHKMKIMIFFNTSSRL